MSVGGFEWSMAGVVGAAWCCRPIPVGESRSEQQLLLIEKTSTRVRTERLEAVRFVPLEHGELL